MCFDIGWVFSGYVWLLVMCPDCLDILEKKAKKGVKSGYYGMCQDLCQDIWSFPVGEKNNFN